jgi:hypothetical protein
LQEVLRRTHVLLKLSSLRSLLPEGACGRTGHARLPAGPAGLAHQLSLLGYQSVVFGLQHRICFKLHPDIGRDKGLEIASQLLLGPVRVVLEALDLLSYRGAACRNLNLFPELPLSARVEIRVLVKGGHAGERPENPLHIGLCAVRDYRNGCNPAPASPNSCLSLLFDLSLSRVERSTPLGDSSLIRLGLFESGAPAYSAACLLTAAAERRPHGTNELRRRILAPECRGRNQITNPRFPGRIGCRFGLGGGSFTKSLMATLLSRPF